jgi:serine/threonine-protein kinase RsbT
VGDEILVPIAGERDIVLARQRGRDLAGGEPFSMTDLTVIATAISEVARNIVLYAGRGEIRVATIRRGDRVGVVITATDHGPGIADVEQALKDGYSTGHGLGLGLPAARRLMDELEVVSQVGVGTTLVMRKWARRP